MIPRAAAHDRLVGGKKGFPNGYYKPWERRCQHFFKCSQRRSQRKGGLTLALLMLGIFANNHHAALALDDLALFADGLHRRTDFHGNTSLG